MGAVCSNGSINPIDTSLTFQQQHSNTEMRKSQSTNFQIKNANQNEVKSTRRLSVNLKFKFICFRLILKQDKIIY